MDRWNEPTPLAELDARKERFFAAMERAVPDWETAILVHRVHHLYFAGTMQDGLLVFRRDGLRRYFARRSFERACDESSLPAGEVVPMESYRDAAAELGKPLGKTCVEREVLPLAMLERMQKHLSMSCVVGLDGVVARVRSVKSAWELGWMQTSGSLHRQLLEEIVPTFLREGMSETDFVAELFEAAVKLGYQGVSRFAMFQNEVGIGQYAFGTNALYPTNFDGPGGSRGMSAAIPFVGDRSCFLSPGTSVFADMGFGVNGYHTDKTQVYFFRGSGKATIPADALAAHEKCREIQSRIAELLVPGNTPDAIYRQIMESLPDDFLPNFQGFGARKVKFLGHGVGLHIDEYPVLARGFCEPLEENMVLAVEPKKGIPGFGTVGVEDTYRVTPSGGECLTGGGREIQLL
ncbi:MAG: M24 family metallopeptidase [Planctomycetia bacterium]|nr:M24 family metallopeptidase [Planctomycetia bacterium]